MGKSNPYRLMYRTQFDVFAEMAFAIVHPGEQLLENWHIGVVAHQLSQFMAGAHNRLIINLPPRSLKSFLTSIAMPAFLLGKDPRLKVLILAGTSDLAKDFRQKVVRLMRSGQYGSVFDQIEFTASERRIDFPQGGSLSFLRYGEAIIGKGYDVIIIDDPQSPSQVEDADLRVKVADYFKNDVLHRLNSKTHGRIVIVQQRLHAGDLSGYFSHRPEWQRLAISAVSRDVEKWPIARGGFATRNKGVALCEERESKQTIAEQLESMGPEKFACQYLQAPGAGTASHQGNGIAWYRPPEDWDGKKRIPWVLLRSPLGEQLVNIKAIYFDGPPFPYIFTDPNPKSTDEEFRRRAVSQQAELVRQVHEDSARWLAGR